MEFQFMRIYRCLMYMDLSGNEYKLYNYLLDKWQNILSKNANVNEVLHSEGQIQIARKLHMTRVTIQNCLKSLEKKKLVEVYCCKELGNINSYKMTDLSKSECYKQLDAKYRYEYEPKVYNSNSNSAKSSSVSSSGNNKATRGARTSVALDYDRLLDYKQVNRICGFLIDNDSFDFTFFDSLDLRRELNLNDFSYNMVSIRKLVDYIKQRYNIDVPEQFLKV